MTIKNDIEALLFASSKYLREDEIVEFLGKDKGSITKALKELKDVYENSDNSLAIIETNGSWKMNVKGDYLQIARKIVTDTELERPVLETLAVIAWKRPIMQSEVVKTRGDHAYQHIRELLDLKFIVRERHGRSYKVKLAEKFFDYFDIEGEQDIREMFSIVQKPDPKLGQLKVVDIEKEKREQLQKDLDQKKLGQLEVIDEPDPYEKLQEEHEELEKIDKELDKISLRNDEHIKELEKYGVGEKKENEEETTEENNNNDDEGAVEEEKQEKNEEF